MTLHEKLGPLATTVSAIAEEAGVQRLTVYRHFPDETRLFEACTGTWLDRNPPPDPASWSNVEDPARRTRTALERLYAYYRRTRGMWSPVFRDLDSVPALEEPMSRFFAYLNSIREDLLGAWNAAGTRPAGANPGAVLGHALRFSTWESLAEEGLTDEAMAGLVLEWLVGPSDVHSRT